MIKKIQGFISWLMGSFDNTKDGSSARKLSAFYAIVIISGMITSKYASDTNVVELTLVWLGFGALCLGMVTAQQLIEFKNGKSKDDAS